MQQELEEDEQQLEEDKQDHQQPPSHPLLLTYPKVDIGLSSQSSFPAQDASNRTCTRMSQEMV